MKRKSLNQRTLKELLKRFEDQALTKSARKQVREMLRHHAQNLARREDSALNKDNILAEVGNKLRVHLLHEAAKRNETKQRPQRMVRLTIAYAIAASIILIICSSLLFIHLGWDHKKNGASGTWGVATAKKGTTVHLLLSDSSEVWLNSGTTLRYPLRFEGRTRLVMLIDGLAYFKIRHDVEKSFIVKSPNTYTQVLGTSFIVADYKTSSESRISVISGKVGVLSVRSSSRKRSFLTLNGGERIHFYKDSRPLLRDRFEVQDQLDWMDGTMRFDHELVGDVILEIQNRYDIQIHLDPSKFKHQYITASFPPNARPVAMVKALCIFMRAHYDVISPNHFMIY